MINPDLITYAVAIVGAGLFTAAGVVAGREGWVRIKDVPNYSRVLELARVQSLVRDNIAMMESLHAAEIARMDELRAASEAENARLRCDMRDMSAVTLAKSIQADKAQQAKKAFGRARNGQFQKADAG